ncbi:flagellar protein FlaG [Pontibacillus litoralis]|uniref:flagellar protein FlaG n=1 Tax=Pontibacillus litoralis TaxID=516703 RepID=UPI00055E098A|nr:flagellar protein FlaG [Pontibacillus litoralis]
MDIGKMLSGSHLLQRADHIIVSTAEAMNDDHSFVKEKKEVTNEKGINKEEARSIVDSLNNFLKPSLSEIRFEFHDKLEEYYVTIIDSNTEEIIKEIPPKKMLDLYASMAELMGFLVDKKI